MNLSLKPETYVELYVHILKGGDLESLKDSWIKTATVNAMVFGTNKFTPDSIFNNAETYRIEIEKQLKFQLAKYFNVDQINAGQHPPKSMKDALQRQADAVLATRQAELNRRTAVATAEQKIAEARGDSAKAVIEASGRAEAIRKEQNAITAEYIDYIKWTNWDGKLPATMLGGNTSVLLSK
jgi:hypothetical protein